MDSDNLTISPTVMCRVNDHVDFNCSLNLDTNSSIRNVLGMQYSLGKNKKADVQFVTNLKDDYMTLGMTMLVMQYQHNGYVMKVPVFTCTQGESWSGIAISAGLALLTNLAFFFGFKSIREGDSRVKRRRDELTIIFGHY